MKDNEEFDIYLESDMQQTVDLLEKKLQFAIMALKDIRIWAEDLSRAKSIASYALDKVDVGYTICKEK